MRGKVTIFIVLTMPQVSVTGVAHRPGVVSLAGYGCPSLIPFPHTVCLQCTSTLLSVSQHSRKYTRCLQRIARQISDKEV